jgi:hypothetical protein
MTNYKRRLEKLERYVAERQKKARATAGSATESANAMEVWQWALYDQGIEAALEAERREQVQDQVTAEDLALAGFEPGRMQRAER